MIVILPVVSYFVSRITGRTKIEGILEQDVQENIRPERKEMPQRSRKLHITDLHNSYCAPNTLCRYRDEFWVVKWGKTYNLFYLEHSQDVGCVMTSLLQQAVLIECSYQIR
jgi:hypothetical protein